MKYTNKLLNLCLRISLRFERFTSKAEIYATVAYSQSLANIIKPSNYDIFTANDF